MLKMRTLTNTVGILTVPVSAFSGRRIHPLQYGEPTDGLRLHAGIVNALAALAVVVVVTGTGIVTANESASGTALVTTAIKKTIVIGEDVLAPQRGVEPRLPTGGGKIEPEPLLRRSKKMLAERTLHLTSNRDNNPSTFSRMFIFSTFYPYYLHLMVHSYFCYCLVPVVVPVDEHLVSCSFDVLCFTNSETNIANYTIDS